ncbi:MAG: aminoacetone oxidase family FAD-binding enzyme [Oscillospiraceae bacterium]|nr:aminoacetone oxidase family FAD-binding enzyme [Oscillospiraceae bacterium]
MENVITTDIAVIGGGAAGITAAISAKQSAPSLNVIIAERLDRTGKKILVTGSGRCNLTNRSISAADYHGSLSYVMDIIRKTQNTEEFFRSLGVLCTADSEGRVYPYSRSAASVLSALRLKLKSLDIPEICGFKAETIEKTKNGYTIKSEDGRIIKCRRIIAACGGYASPANGTDGAALKMFREMGVKTAKICPAVAPLRVDPASVKGLKGVRVHGRVSAVSGDRVLKTEEGEIQFTENSISGICVFDLAYLFSEYEGKLSVKADLMPEYSEKQVISVLKEIKSGRNECTLEEFLNGLFVKNLAVYIMKKSVDIPLNEPVTRLNEKHLSKIAETVKNLSFKITGCSSWQNAQVTSGGIHASEIDASLCLKKDKGIYFAGEILDTDGKCGGYNLEWAWSSGMWAGRNCALSLLNMT